MVYRAVRGGFDYSPQNETTHLEPCALGAAQLLVGEHKHNSEVIDSSSVASLFRPIPTSQSARASPVISRSGSTHREKTLIRATVLQPPGGQRAKKNIFNRLSQAVEEMRKEGHKVQQHTHTCARTHTHMHTLALGQVPVVHVWCLCPKGRGRVLSS